MSDILLYRRQLYVDSDQHLTLRIKGDTVPAVRANDIRVEYVDDGTPMDCPDCGAAMHVETFKTVAPSSELRIPTFERVETKPARVLVCECGSRFGPRDDALDDHRLVWHRHAIREDD